MLSTKKKRIIRRVSKVILLTLLLVLAQRAFIVESYTLSSSQMETSMQQGDKVFVNKMAYGIRLPITLFTVPFTLDTYWAGILFPYKRLFEKGVKRGDVVLFNNPLETEKPLDKRTVLISRCIALSCDNIQMRGDSYFIDNKEYAFASDFMQHYLIPSAGLDTVKGLVSDLQIPVRQMTLKGSPPSLFLNKEEDFVLNQLLGDSVQLKIDRASTLYYSLIVPYSSMKIELTEANMSLYGQAIVQEQAGKARIEKGTLYIGEKVQTNYIFEENYLWVLSDNSSNALDSRTLGFIPFSHVIGKAAYRWSSTKHSLSSVK